MMKANVTIAIAPKDDFAWARKTIEIPFIPTLGQELVWPCKDFGVLAKISEPPMWDAVNNEWIVTCEEFTNGLDKIDLSRQATDGLASHGFEIELVDEPEAAHVS